MSQRLRCLPCMCWDIISCRFLKHVLRRKTTPSLLFVAGRRVKLNMKGHDDCISCSRLLLFPAWAINNSFSHSISDQKQGERIETHPVSNSTSSASWACSRPDMFSRSFLRESSPGSLTGQHSLPHNGLVVLDRVQEGSPANFTLFLYDWGQISCSIERDLGLEQLGWLGCWWVNSDISLWMIPPIQVARVISPSVRFLWMSANVL